jgi:hypothetical protein
MLDVILYTYNYKFNNLISPSSLSDPMKNISSFLLSQNISMEFFIKENDIFIDYFLNKNQKKIDINECDSRNNNILMIIFKSYNFNTLNYKENDYLNLFIKNFIKYFHENLNVNTRNNSNETILHIILKNNYFNLEYDNNLLIFFNFFLNKTDDYFVINEIFLILCLKHIELVDKNNLKYFNSIQFILKTKYKLINVDYSLNDESSFLLSLVSNDLFDLFYNKFDLKIESLNFKIIQRSLFNLNLFNYNNFLEIIKRMNFDINSCNVELRGKNFLIINIEYLNTIQYSLNNYSVKLEFIKLILFKFKSKIDVYFRDNSGNTVFNYLIYENDLKYILDPNLKEIDDFLDVLQEIDF